MLAAGLRVAKGQAEAVRRRLLAEGSLRNDLKPHRSESEVVFPVEDGTDGAVPFDFEENPDRPASYRDRLSLPPDLAALLPTAFDVIGHVVVVKLPEPLLPHRAEIGDALLAAHASARTVALDRGVAGEFRVRRLDVVAGDPDTETEYAESGMRLRVDPAKAYFSPRLGHERARVAALVAPGEVVVDLFAGVGPWAILFARSGAPARVFAVDLNPEAVRLLRLNIERNRVGHLVEAVEADARSFASEHPAIASRVVANLPHGAAAFFEDAVALLGPGGTLHHHAILAPEDLDAHVASLAARAKALRRSVRLLATRTVRAYSPKERHVAIDLRLDA